MNTDIPDPKDPASRVRAIPCEGTQVPIWLPGSSTYNARIAAALGLPFAFASHFAPAYLHEALQLYRQRFTLLSEKLQQPYAKACVNVIAPYTDEQSQRLATSFYILVMGIVTGKPRPLQSPVNSMDEKWADHEKALFEKLGRTRFIPQIINFPYIHHSKYLS